MPTLLQLNVSLNLSTGKITQAIGDMAVAAGWESWIAYSGRSAPVASKSKLIRVGSFLDSCVHFAENRLFDREGLASLIETNKLIRKIKEIKPDVVQLHNIHDHWLNYPILFRCLATLNVPVIWVQHDCWAFTGGCMYFDVFGCKGYQTGCYSCPDKRALFYNRSKTQFSLKKELTKQIQHLTFVVVSDWLGNIMKHSIQKERSIMVIHNGVDISRFKPQKKTIVDDGKFRIIGVAAVWSNRKGLDDFLSLRQLLPSDFEITLVGLSQKQIVSLPSGIRGIRRTTSVEELVQLYSNADVFVNPTYSDNFPTTNIEALACGTPVITYRTGGSPEAIDEKTGIVVEQGDIKSLVSATDQIRSNGKSFYSAHCRKRAEDFFNKDDRYKEYIKLYEILMSNK